MSVQHDALLCSQLTASDLDTATACEAVLTVDGADGDARACTYVPGACPNGCGGTPGACTGTANCKMGASPTASPHVCFRVSGGLISRFSRNLSGQRDGFGLPDCLQLRPDPDVRGAVVVAGRCLPGRVLRGKPRAARAR